MDTKRGTGGTVSKRIFGRAALAAALTCIAGLGAGVASAGALTYNVTAALDPPGATSTELEGVSCPGGTSCVAVGDAVGTAGDTVNAERWNGTAWALLAPVVPARARASRFNAVACPTSSV